MTVRPDVLVVAPDQAMRRSLAFVLEAEGYAVVAVPRLDTVEPYLRAANGRTSVLVVDQDALAERNSPVQELAGLSRPVVLMVEGMRRPPALPWLRIVEKPPLGPDLLEAVAASIKLARTT